MPLKDLVKRKEYQQRYHAKRYANDPEYKVARKATNHGPNRAVTEARRDSKRLGLPQRKAKDAVNGKVRSLKMPKPAHLFCALCGKQAANYHHYLGYEREHWFDVIPVCVPCHAIADREMP